MDKTAPKNKIFLGLFRKCGPNTNLFSNHYIPYNFNHEREVKAEADELRNITDSKFFVNRQNQYTATV